MRTKRKTTPIGAEEKHAREAARVEIQRGLGLSRTQSAGPLLPPEAVSTTPARSLDLVTVGSR
jgi:hypothetical protein